LEVQQESTISTDASVPVELQYQVLTVEQTAEVKITPTPDFLI
jgi:hypothetical protein